MGSVGKNVYFYRTKKLDIVEKFSRKNNYIFECYDLTLFGEEKNKKLADTKIVIHIPSIDGIETFPWSKTAELMCKKIFFIIEYNNEVFRHGLEDIVACYDPSISNDLTNKIKYYLEHENEREKHIEKCHNYIKNNYNMDKFIYKQIFK